MAFISRFVLSMRVIALLLLGIAFFVGLSAHTSLAQGATTFKVGKITLVSLADHPLVDHPFSHDINLFTGASPEIIKALAPSGQAASSINAFLVQTGGKNVLIDTGLGVKPGGELVRSLAHLGLSPADIDVILITHLHFDHIGGIKSTYINE